MAGLFYYRHLLGDYDTATKDLTLLEHGAYRRLLDGYYANKGAIDASKIYRIAGAIEPDEQAAVRKVAGMFFVTLDGFMHHAKCEEEIARVLNESERQSAIARSRWSKEADLASKDAVAPAAAPAAALPMADAAGNAAGNASQSQSQTHSQEPEAKSKKQNIKSLPFKLPSWVEKDVWEEFEKMRVRKRAPMTDYAKWKVVKKLNALRKLGHAPKDVLEQSIEHAWTTVYEVKGERQAGRRGNTEARNDQTASEWAGTEEDET